MPSACGSDALPLTVGAVAVESGADLLIRAAQANDVRRIAQIHVRAWQWAYPDLLPAAFLARLSVVRRATYWRRWLAEAAPHRQLWLVSRDMRRIGFAATGPSRDADGDPSTGEIHALYLEPAAVGTGAGRTLCGHAEAHLRHEGFRAATLWTFEWNARARRFYERRGWHLEGREKTDEWGGRVLREVRYRMALEP